MTPQAALPSSATLRTELSRLGLGGHEYTSDGRLKGFGDDDLSAAVRPGYRRDDFGGAQRRALVEKAVELGVTLFDVTIDPEVSSLGRCLPADAPALVQLRPQGMCYRYETGNPGLIDYPRLRGEVERLTELLNGRHIDILNLGVENDAQAGTPGYLDRLADVIGRLKADGLIRFASCDSLFSGAAQYEALIDTGAFDAVWISFGPLDSAPSDGLLQHAAERGLAVIAREVFAKGALFRLLGDAGLEHDAARAAAAAIRSVLGHPGVSTLVVGARDADQLAAAVDAAGTPLDDSDRELLDRLLSTPAAARLARENRAKFLNPSA